MIEGRRGAGHATSGKRRKLAAWLGLVPRQVTIGGRHRLIEVTKISSSVAITIPGLTVFEN
ncbi:hypothetical protein GI374_18210 [Paracoccus sp. S-4012]|nr:hypothetical protein [Paracoccus sp. S-4012]MRX52275.1 hypothetical protein [Paracoccus sp. S-4012]